MMTQDASVSIGDGIYTPIPTIFNSKNELDLEAQAKHAKFLYESGVNGLVVSGSMGESIHMRQSERIQLLKTVREAVPDKEFKLIAGIPPLNIEDAVEEIGLADEAGADYMIILTPGYYGVNLTRQAGMVDFFTAVADRSSLPIIIYNFPGVCNGVDLDVDTYTKLSKHKSIIGVKLTHFNMDKYIMLAAQAEQNKANNFKPFTGLGQTLVPALSIGAHGAIDGMSGVFPKSMVKLLSLYKAGKYDEAVKLQLLVTRANRFTLDFNLVGIKYLLNQLYSIGDGTTGRPPLNYGVEEKEFANYKEDVMNLYEYEKKL